MMIARDRATGLLVGGALLGASVAFWPLFINSGSPLRWIILGVALPVAVAFGPKIKIGIGHIIGLMLAAWIVVSLIWTPDPRSGEARAAQIVLVFAAAFIAGTQHEDLTNAWRGLSLGLTVSAIIAALQRFDGLVLIQQYSVPAGLFLNRDILAEAAVLSFIACMTRRDWPFMLGPGAAFALSASRASLVALSVVGALIALERSPPRIAPRAVIGFLFVFAAAFTAGSMLLHIDYDIEARLDIWRALLSDLAPLGRGIGSLWVDFPYVGQTHNDPLQILYEFGPGAALAAAIAIFALGGKASRERHILLAAIIIGLFSFPMETPMAGCVAALAAGRLCRGRALVWPWLSARRIGSCQDPG